MPNASLPKLDPDVRLSGNVDDEMLKGFLKDYAAAVGAGGPILVEITTIGGDADVGRRISLELRLGLERGHDVWLLGKTIVYSAGVTVLAGLPVERRFLSRDAVLLIHERRMDKPMHIIGPLRASAALARDLLAEIENGQRLEREGFEQLVDGSRISIDELMAHAMAGNWYLPAAEALDRGLVAGVV